MEATIHGDILPVLELMLYPGEAVVAETGELSWKDPAIAMRTTTNAAGVSGFLGAISRAIGGSSVFMTEYSAPQAAGVVAFAAKVPGRILEIEAAPGREFVVHRHGYLCGEPNVTLTVEVQQRLGIGFFGGSAFMLQRVAGAGRFWVELGGEVVQRTLEAGQALDVHPGHVGMYDSSVGMELTTVPGLVNKVFGGDGIFLARLFGPGRVWLQTLTVPDLARAVQPYLPVQTASTGNT